jgi:hypothetical protein
VLLVWLGSQPDACSRARHGARMRNGQLGSVGDRKVIHGTGALRLFPTFWWAGGAAEVHEISAADVDVERNLGLLESCKFNWQNLTC